MDFFVDKNGNLVNGRKHPAIGFYLLVECQGIGAGGGREAPEGDGGGMMYDERRMMYDGRCVDLGNFGDAERGADGFCGLLASGYDGLAVGQLL